MASTPTSATVKSSEVENLVKVKKEKKTPKTRKIDVLEPPKMTRKRARLSLPQPLGVTSSTDYTPLTTSSSATAPRRLSAPAKTVEKIKVMPKKKKTRY